MAEQYISTVFQTGTEADEHFSFLKSINNNRLQTGSRFLNDAGNWTEIDLPETNVTFGTTAGTACEGNDARLANKRDPNPHTDNDHSGSAKRNAAGGVAALNDDKILSLENTPVAGKQICLSGKYLDGSDNPDTWLPIAGNGSIAYNARKLLLTGGVNVVSGTRAVFEQQTYSASARLREITFQLGDVINGTGARYISMGFQPAFNAFYVTNRAAFVNRYGVWEVGATNPGTAVSTTSLGRSLVAGDVCTVRIINETINSQTLTKTQYFVNGMLIFDEQVAPSVNVYAGIGVFSGTDSTIATSVEISFAGLKIIP